MTRFLLLFLFCSQGGGDKNNDNITAAHEITLNINLTTYYSMPSESPKWYEAPNAMFDEHVANDDSDRNLSNLPLVTSLVQYIYYGCN